MELRTFVSAFSLRVPRTNSIVRASTVTRPSLTRGVGGPGSPGRRQIDLVPIDVIERALCVGGDLRAVGEMDVAVEIRLLDGAEAGLRLHGQRQRARDALDRGRVLPRARASRGTRRCRRRSRSAGRCRAPLSPVSVADRMRLAGAAPSAGRSTWTFSVALRLVTRACRPGPWPMSIVLAAIRLPALPPLPGSCTTLSSTSSACCSVRPSSAYVRSMSRADMDCGPRRAAAADAAVAAQLQLLHALVVFGQANGDLVGVDDPPFGRDVRAFRSAACSARPAPCPPRSAVASSAPCPFSSAGDGDVRLDRAARGLRGCDRRSRRRRCPSCARA